MKQIKNGTLKNSTGTLLIHPNGTAYSYKWYKLGEFINPYIYLMNSFPYSTTTIKHRALTFRALNHPTHIDVYAPRGLDGIEATKEEMLSMIEREYEKLKKARTVGTRERYQENIQTLSYALKTYLDFKNKQGDK